MQVWYGVPANASAALEEAMQDALPDLFEASPDLMYQLVTMVSPLNLQVCIRPLSPNLQLQLARKVYHGSPPLNLQVCVVHSSMHRPLSHSWLANLKVEGGLVSVVVMSC